MKFFCIAAVIYAAGFSERTFAQTFMPPSDARYFELGLEAFQQEVPGLRMNVAYLMNMGVPALLSKIGMDFGLQFFPSLDGPAPEYGFFLASTVYRASSYAAYVKTGLYTLAFPEYEASATSMSSVLIEPGLEWERNGVFWTAAVGVRYRSQDPDVIEVGSTRIEKNWLFYPKIGVSGRF